MGVKQQLVNEFKKILNSGGNIQKEHRDYILCKEIYHCTPAELDAVAEDELELHFRFYNEEKKHEFLQQKRNEQSASLHRK